MDKLIIHISGASGSGKTTLGNKLKEHLKKSVIVKDLDYLRDEHIEKTYDITKPWSVDEVKYQKYINDFINKQKKPIIFVGLNDNPKGEKKIYYDTQAQYKFYIDIDYKEILKQKCLRMLTEEIPNDKDAMRDLVENNEQFIKGIKYAIENSCDLKKMVKQNNKWKKDYEKQGYKFMSRKNIYKSVIKILNK